MSLRTGAFLALVGTFLLTVVVAADFTQTLLGVMRDVAPVIALVRSFIYLLASLAVTVFLFLFYRAQGR